MAISTNAVKLVLRQGMGAVQADALAAWLEAMQTDVAAVTALLDADLSITGTSYAAALTVTD